MTKEQIIERAKKIQFSSNPKDYIQFVGEILDDEQESEDERIRENLIKMVRNVQNDSTEKSYYDIPFDEYIAWLEKQKPSVWDSPIMTNEMLVGKVTEQKQELDGKDLLYVQNKSYKIGFRDGVNSVKPVEWSKEHINLEDAVKDYFQGLWPGMETPEQCNTDMHFTPPAIMRLVTHFYELGHKK